MRTKKFIYNSLSYALLQAITFAVGMVLPRLYLAFYGSEVNGLVSSITHFISYFCYVEAGLGKTLTYALFKPLADQDICKINAIVSMAKKSYIKTSGLNFLLVICLSIVYPFMVKSENIHVETIVLLVLVMGFLSTLDFYTMAKYRVLLTADQREYVISITSILGLAVNFILIVFFIRRGASIILVRAVPLATFAVRSLLLYLYVKKKYPYIRYDKKSDNIYLTGRFDALIMELSINFAISAPTVIISIFCSLKLASVYSIYNMVFEGLTGILSVFTAGVSASFGNVIAKKEFDVLEKAHEQFELLIYSVMAVLYSSAFILINPFIALYTKGIADINYVNGIYGILFTLGGILHNVRIPYTALVNASGLYKEIRSINIWAIALQMLLSLVLVQFFNINGVLMAFIIASFYRSVNLILVVKPLVIKETPIMKTFLRAVLIFAIAAFSYIPFIYWIQISVTNLFSWIIWAFGVTVWCTMITILINFLFDRRVFIDTFLRIMELIKIRCNGSIQKGNFSHFFSKRLLVFKSIKNTRRATAFRDSMYHGKGTR